MIIDLHYYTGTVYTSLDEVIEILDTDGPASHIVRLGVSGAAVLSAAQRRSDNSQWTVANYFRANNTDCTAKLVRQTYVFVEFEP